MLCLEEEIQAHFAMQLPLTVNNAPEVFWRITAIIN